MHQNLYLVQNKNSTEDSQVYRKFSKLMKKVVSLSKNNTIDDNQLRFLRALLAFCLSRDEWNNIHIRTGDILYRTGFTVEEFLRARISLEKANLIKVGLNDRVFGTTEYQINFDEIENKVKRVNKGA